MTERMAQQGNDTSGRGRLANVCAIVHDGIMPEEVVIILRIPEALKRELESRAQQHRRSVSAQIATYLEQALQQEPPVPTGARGRLLGLYQGSPVPTDEQFADVRRRLWGTLGVRAN